MNRNEDYRKSEDWLRFRKHWLQDNPSIDGYYLCGVCGHWVSDEEVTLDHIEPRKASNIFDGDNLQPAHWLCNSRKGSRHWTPKVKKEEHTFLSWLSQL